MYNLFECEQEPVIERLSKTELERLKEAAVEDKHIFESRTKAFDRKNNPDFFSEHNEHHLSSSNFPIAFFSLVALMAEDCNYNLNAIYCSGGRLFVEGIYKDKPFENEMMLRYSRDDLVLARISFIHRHQGNMTKLFEMLKYIGKRYGYKRVVIESVMTDEMDFWCMKNKLESDGMCSYFYTLD